MAGYELATAYVNLVASADGLGKEIEQKVGEAGDKGGKAGGKRAGAAFGGAVGRAMKTVGKAGLLGAGAAAAATIFGGFQSGIGQQQAQKVLSGLYGDAGLAAKTLQGLAQVSKASPLDASSYRKAAESLAYAGVQGEDAIGILKNVGLAITASGGDSQNLTRATDAILNMVNAGKVQLDTLQQLANSGTPILSGLAAHFGTSIAQVNKMASAGKIQLSDVLSVMQNATGKTFQTMKKAGTAASQSFGNQWKIAKDNVSEAVGRVLLPMIEKLTPAISKIASFISDKLVPAAEKFFGFLSDNKATILTFVGILGGVVTAVKLWTGAQRILNVVMKANPVMLVVTAIAALVAGFIHLWNKSEAFRNFWKGLWSKIKGAVSAVVDWFKDLPGTVARIFGDVVDWFADLPSTIWGAVKDGASWLTDKAGDLIGWILSGIKGVASDVWNWFKKLPARAWKGVKALSSKITDYGGDLLGWIWDGIKDIATDVWTWFKKLPGRAWSGIKAISSKITRYGKDFLGWIWSGIKDVSSDVLTWFRKLPGRIWDKIKAFSTWLTNRGKSILRWLWRGILNKVGDVYDWFRKLPGRLWDRIKRFSTWLTNRGKNILGWLWNGIKNAAGDVWGWFKKLPGRIWNAIKNAVGGAATWLGTKGGKILGWIWSGIKNGAGAVWDWFKKMPGKVWNAIKNAVGGAATWLGKKGQAFIGWVGDGIVDGASALWSWVSDLPSKLWNALSGIASQLFDFGVGLWNAIVGGMDSALERSRSHFLSKSHPVGSGGGGGAMMFRASGGPVSAGSRYVVGEEGPELFVPNRSGTIIPNHKAFGSAVSAPASSGDTYVNVTVDMSDLEQLRTLEDFLSMLRVKTRMGVA